MKKLFIIVLIITLPVLLMAQEGKLGTAGAQFLKIGLGARATGMAGAYTAVADNAEAIFWNPGALAQVESNDFSGAYVKWPADIVYSGAAFATNIEGFGVLGFHIAGLKAGDMRVRTLFNPEGDGRMFSASQFAGGISFATFLTDRFSVGATWKYIQEDFFDYGKGLGCRCWNLLSNRLSFSGYRNEYNELWT
jgi:long-subunit fatty acid transport protein